MRRAKKEKKLSRQLGGARRHAEQVCPKTGRAAKRRFDLGWARWVFPAAGLVSLIWFLMRVIPKPSRAAYPCQRVAVPLASGFVLWILGVFGSVFAYRSAKGLFRRSRMGWAAVCLMIAGMAGAVALLNMPTEPVTAATKLANAPIGVGRGIHPGRVVWAYDPDATDWAGTNDAGDDMGDGYYWESSHTDQAVVDRMMSGAIQSLAGEATAAGAWDAIFRHFNQNRGRENVGYRAGEKITIKINMSTSIQYIDEQGNQTQRLGWVNTSPQMILALLRQLVNVVGVAQSDITVGDTTAYFPNHYWNHCHGEFPNVQYLAMTGDWGRRGAVSSQESWSETPIYWSATDAMETRQDYLPVSYAEAEYLIDFACLKGHSAGVTLSAKNHYGSLIRIPDERNYYNLHLSLPNAEWSPGMGRYRAQVDILGHSGLGGKTLLFLIDGLYGGYYWEGRPYKWGMAPFNGDWPSSLFVSQDPTAIDSVAYDFLLEEWPHVVADPGLQGGAEDYLHEAALADYPPSQTFYDPENDGTPLTSLGTHEHWNNPVDKQYSRDLGFDSGIELIRYQVTNQSPQVDAGIDQTITLPVDTVNLDGTVSDDGLPDPPGALATTWSKVSGPSGVTFADAGSVDTQATFGSAGTFVLELEARDGALSAGDTLRVIVLSPEEPTLYALTAGVVGGHGTLDVDPDTQMYLPGTVVTLTATPDQDWQFDHWQGDLVGSYNPAVLTMTADKTVMAVFTKIQRTLTVAIDGQGSVAPAGGSYDIGSELSLTATPAAGWQFDHWQGDLVGSDNPAVLTMTTDKTVTAVFTKIQRTLTVAIDGQGSVEPAGGSFDIGSELSLTATPATGWQFDHWQGDLVGSDNPAVLTMTADRTVTAVFTETSAPPPSPPPAPVEHTLTVTVKGQGQVTPSGGTFEKGTEVTLSPLPAYYWHFDHWQGDLVGSDDPAMIAMTSDKTVTAVFVKNQPNEAALVVRVLGKGSVVPGGGLYEKGTVVTLTAHPAHNWYFSSWDGKVSASEAHNLSLVLTIDNNTIITAEFKEGSLAPPPPAAPQVDLGGCPITGLAVILAVCLVCPMLAGRKD